RPAYDCNECRGDTARDPRKNDCSCIPLQEWERLQEEIAIKENPYYGMEGVQYTPGSAQSGMAECHADGARRIYDLRVCATKVGIENLCKSSLSHLWYWTRSQFKKKYCTGSPPEL